MSTLIQVVPLIPDAREYLVIDQKKEKLTKLRELSPRYIPLEKVEEQEEHLDELERKAQQPAFQMALEVVKAETSYVSSVAPEPPKEEKAAPKLRIVGYQEDFNEVQPEKGIRTANLEALDQLLINPEIDPKELISVYGEDKRGKSFSWVMAARSMSAAVSIAESKIKRGAAKPQESELLQRIDTFVGLHGLEKRRAFLAWFYHRVSPKAPQEAAQPQAEVKQGSVSAPEVVEPEKQIPHIRPESFETFAMFLDDPDTPLATLISDMGKLRSGKRYSRGTTYNALVGTLRLAEKNLSNKVANIEEELLISEIDSFIKEYGFPNKEAFLEFLKKEKFEITSPSKETIDQVEIGIAQPMVIIEAQRQTREKVLALEKQRPTIRQDLNEILDVIEQRGEGREYFSLGHMDRFFGIGQPVALKAVDDRYIKPTSFQGGERSHPMLSIAETALVYYRTKYGNDLNARRRKDLNTILTQEIQKREAKHE